mgnify:FL=1
MLITIKKWTGRTGRNGKQDGKPTGQCWRGLRVKTGRTGTFRTHAHICIPLYINKYIYIYVYVYIYTLSTRSCPPALIVYRNMDG